MEVRIAGEGIRSCEEAAQDMDDFKVEVSKVEKPPCLTVVEVLWLMEVCQILVVCKDLDGERGTMEIVSPGFQSVDDCKELSVIDVVVLFCRDKQLGEVGTGMPIAIGVCLEEDGTRGVL